MALSGIYIYCFIREGEKKILGNSAIDGSIAPVYTLSHEGIAAVVSDTSVMEYDPTRKNVLAHQHVINKVTEKYTIVPVAFGTIANGKAEVEKMISSNLKQFDELLEYFEDKVELGLRVTWNNDFFNEDIENDEIKALKQKVAGKDEDEVLTEKVELGRMVEAETLAKKDQYENEIFKPLSKIAVDSKLKDGIPIKTVFNAYFLVEKSRSDEFDTLVESVSQPYENKLNFSYTGPWPAYNFVGSEININTDID